MSKIVASIQYYNIVLGHHISITTMDRSFYLLRGIRQSLGDSRTRIPRQPITLPQLRQLVHLFSIHTIHTTAQCSLVRSPLPSLGCFGFPNTRRQRENRMIQPTPCCIQTFSWPHPYVWQPFVSKLPKQIPLNLVASFVWWSYKTIYALWQPYTDIIAVTYCVMARCMSSPLAYSSPETTLPPYSGCLQRMKNFFPWVFPKTGPFSLSFCLKNILFSLSPISKHTFFPEFL